MKVDYHLADMTYTPPCIKVENVYSNLEKVRNSISGGGYEVIDFRPPVLNDYYIAAGNSQACRWSLVQACTVGPRLILKKKPRKVFTFKQIDKPVPGCWFKTEYGMHIWDSISGTRDMIVEYYLVTETAEK
jgi:hypothetical protein